MIPNLDCMTSDELSAFWKRYHRASRKDAAELIGDCRPGYPPLPQSESLGLAALKGRNMPRITKRQRQIAREHVSPPCEIEALAILRTVGLIREGQRWGRDIPVNMVNGYVRPTALSERAPSGTKYTCTGIYVAHPNAWARLNWRNDLSSWRTTSVVVGREWLRGWRLAGGVMR